jgi:hypothetical protein
MWWNTAAFFVEHMTSNELIADFPSSFVLTGHTFQAKDAFSSSLPVPFAIGQVGLWTALCDPLCIITWREPMLAAFSRERRIFAFVAERLSHTYGFWYFVHGQLIRHVLFQEEECVEEIGEVLLPEAQSRQNSHIYDDMSILHIWESLTGLNQQQLAACSFQGLANDLYRS